MEVVRKGDGEMKKVQVEVELFEEGDMVLVLSSAKGVVVENEEFDALYGSEVKVCLYEELDSNHHLGQIYDFEHSLVRLDKEGK